MISVEGLQELEVQEGDAFADLRVDDVFLAGEDLYLGLVFVFGPAGLEVFDLEWFEVSVCLEELLMAFLELLWDILVLFGFIGEISFQFWYLSQLVL